LITFNVIFTPDSVARLLPFGLSLLQGESVRVRLVSNGCGAGEAEALTRAAEGDERLSSHRLASGFPVEHGVALNSLFEEFPEGSFAFADSDVLASGDFMEELWPLGEGEAAVFAASPSWLAPGEEIATADARLLSGRRRALADGTPVGGTYCAIYDRSAAEEAWSAAPRGFAVHHWHQLPRQLKSRLSERGWRFRTYDTGRLVNLELLLAGRRLSNRDVAALHHVGGFSARTFEGPGGMARTAAAMLRSRSGMLSRLWRGAVSRLISATDRNRSGGGRARRRLLVLDYLDAVVDAVIAGRRPPPAPATGSPEVDRKVAALTDAIERVYPRYVQAPRERTGEG
jgi:hypothetical protein